jgi:BASS family bile acid:Na+ symporter
MTVLLFPVWALLISLIAFGFPEYFVDLKSAIVPLLMLVMLGMGLTLSLQDFKQVWQYRKIVVVGVILQFLIMPLAAWSISLAMGLSLELMIGMMLVGATAGGTASNVMAYLANGDVALSVSMTMVSTLAAVFMLPLLTLLYLGQSVDVQALSMLGMLAKIIVLPIAAGMVLHHFLKDKVEVLIPWFTKFSMAVILLIIAIVVALNSENIMTVAWSLIGAVILHNLIGLASGYWISRKLGYNSVVARTVAIEVGMQNSGLSVALALKYFTAVSALPGAMFSIWHNISGAMFASYWAKDDELHNSKSD